ncbi:inositol monophosphatase family protein [Nocardioides sp. Kera G14]|uniref:inositol monophosphatase family protein n=1 Tax=Nocardioides sp. Kera G14 TaxID=2884264 RepID=UPI001D1241ED|nr:inositol monophosphatase family protein [Nocardioides sp. Kera G14]UDY22187.1 inositol monophosphatase family protein [Nocardioides sp. Kera G14]
MPDRSDVALAGELVREAGRLAASMRAKGVAVSSKTSISDVVTEADHAAEALIVDRLATERPDDGVLGEEGAASEGTSGRRWIIDPVDGTYNFVSGLTWWCSALALVDGDELVLGAIYHPYEDVLYLGGPDLPSTRNGEPIPPIADRPLSTSCVTTYLHPPWYGGEVGVAHQRVVTRAATQRMLGSGSMDMAAVAQGQLHLFCQHTVPLWDRLPGEALILGAGGVARQVEAAGKLWSVIGAPTAVAEALAALEDR